MGTISRQSQRLPEGGRRAAPHDAELDFISLKWRHTGRNAHFGVRTGCSLLGRVVWDYPRHVRSANAKRVLAAFASARRRTVGKQLEPRHDERWLLNATDNVRQ